METLQDSDLTHHSTTIINGDRGVHIHAINLDRRNDRLAALKSHAEESKVMAGVSLYRFPAVDGTAEKEQLKKLAPIFKGNDFKFAAGVTGCAVSHLLLWQQLLQTCSLSYAIMIEDDAKFTPEFSQWATQFAKVEAIDRDWDIIYLGMFGSDKGDDEFLNYDDERLDNGNIIKFGEERRVSASGAFAYALSRRGAAKLLALAHTRKVRRAIDMVMIDAFQYGVRGYLLRPPMVEVVQWFAGNTKDTDIQQEVFVVQHAKDGETCRLLSYESQSIGVMLEARDAEVFVADVVAGGASDQFDIKVGDRIATVADELVFTAAQTVGLLQKAPRPLGVLVCHDQRLSRSCESDNWV
jgi:GR25 family glycosyltransferase involved in LPS biosynthesis